MALSERHRLHNNNKSRKCQHIKQTNEFIFIKKNYLFNETIYLI